MMLERLLGPIGRRGLPLPDFVSAQQTVSADTLLEVPHGFGAKPTLFLGLLVCTTADLGFSVGNEFSVSELGEVGGIDTGAIVYADATNISVIQGQSITVFNKSTFNYAAITLASWRWVFKAWR